MSNGVNFSAGPDFVLLRDEVTFDMGANDGNTINAFIDIVDDLMVEGTEFLTLSGSIGSPAATGSSFVGGPVTVTILDNDGKIMYAIAECGELD